ncbi:MAG: 3-hydroxyacyl-CoA dehydrogenase [Deltaproteobacteria bacterium]|nr:3-hydroxyacyl-CoA dehydrogenase [Deltaproteobacteria bacterium]MBW1904934.1 3-hydroxyacyl-CoA dehydrogenase [Deltaproteobacteria bacterium]MBW2159588.1 3-hydroxyacyl-CoA dehydrogenase [Deltaproteobacteria bacterium]
MVLVVGCTLALGCGGTATGGPGGSGGAQAPTHLYFLNWAGGVLSTTLDGNELRDFADGESQGADGVAVDGVARHVYWTNMGVAASNDGFVMRAELDGTNITTIVPPGGTHTPKQLRIDPVNAKLYWSDREGMRVMRANLDGSDIETLVTIATGDAARSDLANHAVGMALDVAARQFYWSQKGPTEGGVGAIKRASFDMPNGEDSTNRSDIEVLFEGLLEPIDLDLDVDEDMLYWTDRGDDTVSRAPMALPLGASAATRDDREILVRDVGEAIGLTLDLGAGKMYYTGIVTGAVGTANLDGSNPTEIIRGNWLLTGITLGPDP